MKKKNLIGITCVACSFLLCGSSEASRGVSALQARLSSFNRMRQATANAAPAAARQDIPASVTAPSVLKSNNNNLSAKISQLESDLRRQASLKEQEVKQLKEEALELRTSIAELKEQIENDNSSTEALKTNMQTELTKLQNELILKGNEIEAAGVSVQNLTKSNSEAIAEINLLTKELSDTKKVLLEKENELELARQNPVVSAEEVQRLEKELQALKESLNSKNSELTRFVDAENFLIEKLESLRVKARSRGEIAKQINLTKMFYVQKPADDVLQASFNGSMVLLRGLLMSGDLQEDYAGNSDWLSFSLFTVLKREMSGLPVDARQEAESDETVFDCFSEVSSAVLGVMTDKTVDGLIEYIGQSNGETYLKTIEDVLDNKLHGYSLENISTLANFFGLLLLVQSAEFGCMGDYAFELGRTLEANEMSGNVPTLKDEALKKVLEGLVCYNPEVLRLCQLILSRSYVDRAFDHTNTDIATKVASIKDAAATAHVSSDDGERERDRLVS